MIKQTSVLAVDLRVKRNFQVFKCADKVFAMLVDLEKDDQREEVLNLIIEWATDRGISLKVPATK